MVKRKGSAVKVRRILQDQFVPWPEKVTAAQVVLEGNVYAKFDDRTWSTHTDSYSGGSVEGVGAGGFNSSVNDAVEAIRKLRLITRADEVAFDKWLDKERVRHREEHDVVHVRREAARLGYKIVKMKKKGE